MDALILAIRLFEKVAVLVSATLILVLLRPAEVWLSERGTKPSLRRSAFLATVLGALSIWGIFLGFELDGMRFNTRAIGIIVAGFLGGPWVGLAVGGAAGIANSFFSPNDLPAFMLAASLINGLVAGFWGRRFGTRLRTVILGAIVAQLVHHVALGGLLIVVHPAQAMLLSGNILLHIIKVSAVTVGVALFMGLLALVRELEVARQEVQTSRDAARLAQLEALQYQVRPHFLFNLLNTLAYLIRTHPLRARELTLDLAEFFRYTLSQTQGETTLAEELRQIERYVELERARFGEGLRFSIALPDDEAAASMPVPPLILQPLVENALRHGSRDGQVDVCIDIGVEPEAITVRVLDDGPGPPGPLHELRAVVKRSAKLVDGEWEMGDGLTPLDNAERIQPDRPTRKKSLLRRGNDSSRRGVGLVNVEERLARFYHRPIALALTSRGLDDVKRPGCIAEFRVPRDAFDTADSASSGRYVLAEQAREQLKKVLRA